MQRIVSLLSTVVLVTGVTCGCTQQANQQGGTGEAIDLLATGDTVTLCGQCGQIKGSGVCCQTYATLCEKCALAKGSPGCCQIAKGEDVTLCANCGHTKGSQECCQPDALECEKCGLAKGSIGCCKISS